MHSRLFVLFDKDEAENSEAARNVASEMLDANGFTGLGGVFSSPPADWYSIGGRWSGELTWLHLGPEKQDELWKKAKERHGIEGIPFKESETHQQLRAIFREMFPDFPADKAEPVARNPHKSCEDDAMLLDETLAKFLKELKQYPDGNLHDGECWVDLSDFDNQYDLMEQLGKKWVVVVDFHA
jgi:hypothetical protein